VKERRHGMKDNKKMRFVKEQRKEEKEGCNDPKK
jgi:hypothetical protein